MKSVSYDSLLYRIEARAVRSSQSLCGASESQREEKGTNSVFLGSATISGIPRILDARLR